MSDGHVFLAAQVFKLLVDGETVNTITFWSRNGLYVQQAFDISGCRYAGLIDFESSEKQSCRLVVLVC